MAARWSDGVAVVGEAPNRRVIATRSLKKSAIILRETPITTLLHPKQWSVRCNSCFSKPTGTKLLRCSRCKRFYYCSKKCQRLDWKVHKEECTALTKHVDSLSADQTGFLADALLVARVFRLKRTALDDFKRIEDLLFHEECIQQHHRDIAKLFMTMKLLDDSNNTAMDTTVRDIVEMLARFDSNNFGIVDELLFFLGAGVFPAGAMLNHSCDHNCAVSYEAKSNTQVIRCIVDVTEGDELCHPYIDFASTSKQRRDKLKTTYGFECLCDRCRDPTGKWAQADEWLQGAAPLTNHLSACKCIEDTERLLQKAATTEDIQEELHLIQQCVAARSQLLHPRHLALYLARSQLHTTSMAAGELTVAKEQCVEIVQTMRTCFYRPEHPLMGIMLYTLGSLHHSLGCKDDAIECYEEALPTLESYHGVYHSFTTGCRDYLQQARLEAGRISHT